MRKTRLNTLCGCVLALLWSGCGGDPEAELYAMSGSEQAVVRFVLVDPSTDQDIGPLEDGQTVQLTPSQAITIRAETSPASVGSVVFRLDGVQHNVENVAPYFLAGDRAGDAGPWSYSEGGHTLTATPYSKASRGGTAGKPLSIAFLLSSGGKGEDPVIDPPDDKDPAARPTQLSVSTDRRHLQNAAGVPVYLLGDTAWTLPENGSRQDVDDYLEDRAAKGYNYVQIVAARDLHTEPLDSSIASRTMNPTNKNGHTPFEWASGKADPGKPISVAGGTPDAPNDYWDHVEYILQRASALGMYVGVLPTWGKYYINHPNANMRIFTVKNARVYASFLGQRYRSHQNIIWILGGDTRPEAKLDGKPIYRAMAEGLVEGVTGQAPAWNEDHLAWSRLLITYHGGPASAEYFNDDAWLKLNMVYRNDAELLANVQKYYVNTPTRPMLQGECSYEGYVWDGTHITARTIRRQLHHTFFGGGIGHMYGTAASSTAVQDQLFRFQSGWRGRLDMPGATAAGHLKRILEESRWWTWSPAQEVLGASTKSVALEASKADQIVVYFPWAAVEQVNLGAITTHPRVKATWHDPRTGDRQSGGVFSADARIDFVPPTTWEDAVLLLDGTHDPLSGSGPATKEFHTVNGEIVLSAEDYSYTGGSMGSWQLGKSLGGHLDAGYMQSSVDNPSLKFDSAIAALSYVITFNEAGRYYVHLRTFAVDHTENGFFATLDGQEIDYGGANPQDAAKEAYFIYVQKKNAWSWYTDGGGAETRDLRVSFNVPSPGKHVFSIHRRDTGSRIDHIWLTKNQSKPQNVTSLPLPAPATFR